MSRFLTVLGCIVSVAATTAPQIAQRHPDVAYWLTLAGIIAMALGREIVSRDELLRFGAKKLSLLFMIIILVGSMTACEGVGRKIVSYSDKATRTVERLQDAQVISVEEAKSIKPFISDVRAGAVEYDEIERLIVTTKEEKLSKRERLNVISQKIIASLRRLESEGVLHIKNPEARQKLQKGLAFAEIIADFAQ